MDSNSAPYWSGRIATDSGSGFSCMQPHVAQYSHNHYRRMDDIVSRHNQQGRGL